MQTRSRDLFLTVRTEGAILPSDLLERIAAGDPDLGGLTPEAYHLPAGEKITETTNRAWNRLLAAWSGFRTASERLPSNDAGTTLTREKWLLPVFQELGYGRLLTVKAAEIDGKSYAISHGWHHTPIHLLGLRVDLDRPSQRVAGASRSSPHSLLQEFLNRSKDHLWGIVSNGLKLRILRDNVSLTRQSYVEFDLEAMMLGECYSDFVLLWLLCHQSRVEAELASDCWLEKWSQSSRERGVRALEQLRTGVEEAITCLGRGFLAYPANGALRARLRSGDLDAQDYYRQVLRLVYRLLFLFVAEERALLLLPGEEREAARLRYLRHYSTARLRRLAERRSGTRHGDLYVTLRLVMQKLGSDAGCPGLALPALGSFLFSPTAMPDIERCDIANHDLLDAVRALAVTVADGALRSVDYKNLGAEELGSVYESLLELRPELNVDAPLFRLTTASGHERKTSGSYYTPTSLIDCLLDAALESILDEVWKAPDSEAAILKLKVVDPACGSGHFLIAAAHRIAKRLATARTGDEEPSPDALRKALRDVIGHCIYGVDVNPMAVELCKVNLWLEALDPGKPLSFLDHRIQCGNSLIGATPALLSAGIPDEAFDPAEGDDKKVCQRYKKLNQQERFGRQSLFDENLQPWDQLGNFAAGLLSLDNLSDDTIEGVRQKERIYEEAVRSSGYLFGKFWADTWCAAFAWRKSGNTTYAITEEVFRRIERNPHAVDPWLQTEVERLASAYRFFHWHLAFPDVFSLPRPGEAALNTATGWNGGFTVVLGNPPWVRQETLKADKKFFATFESFRSTADSSVLFLERSLTVAAARGRVGMLTPNKWFRATYAEGLRELLRDRSRLFLLVDFGHSRNLFPAADTFPAAVVFEPVPTRVPDDTTLSFVEAHDSEREKVGLPELIRTKSILVYHRDLRSDRWQLEGTAISRLLDRLMATGRPLVEYAGRRPIRGLLTGLNTAFYLDTAARDRLVEEDPNCTPLLKKFLRGRDIKRWTSEWGDQWHIVIPSSQNRVWPWSDSANESAGEETFATCYPSVHRHLKAFEEPLRKRADKGRFWWELRQCDYYEAFDGPKIVVQCIAYFSQFALDREGHYVNNKVLFVPSEDLYLLAILNSRVAWWVINRTFQHMKDDGVSVDVQFLLALPIPDAKVSLRAEIESLTKRLLDLSQSSVTSVAEESEIELRLNSLVQQAFNLTPEEVDVLERSLPPRDPIALLPTGAAVKTSGVPAPVAEPIGVPSLDLVASGAWATPPGIQPSNFVLLAIAEVLHRFGGPIDPHRVWMAVHFMRNPAMALAFLDKARLRDWVRVIGPGAQPIQKNVIDISRFRRGATDQLWGDAIIYLKSIGALVESSGLWSVTSKAPAPADEEWLAGRADMAVQVALQLADEQETELRLAEFLRSVEDGTARRAVS
ncbi:MAG: N-6 DNA methylase [Chloroflexi bacterium]|nr:N-6 DNA methylase [Chloroflexota bacterium]